MWLLLYLLRSTPNCTLIKYRCTIQNMDYYFFSTCGITCFFSFFFLPVHSPWWSASGSENKDPQVQGVDYQNMEWNRTGGWNFLLCCFAMFHNLLFFMLHSLSDMCVCVFFFTSQVSCLFVASISFGKYLIKGIKPVIIREILDHL